MLQRLRKCTAVLNVKKRLGGNLENLDPPKMNKSEQVIVFEFTRLHKNVIIFTGFRHQRTLRFNLFILRNLYFLQKSFISLTLEVRNCSCFIDINLLWIVWSSSKGRGLKYCFEPIQAFPFNCHCLSIYNWDQNG